MDQKKEHIVFLSAWYPSPCDKMFGLFVRRHAEALSEKYRVTVIYPSYCKDIKTGIFTIVNKDVTEVNINIRSVNKILKWFYFVLLHLKAYRYVIKKFGKPILNHVHILTREGIIALMFKYLYDIPYVVTEHWSRYVLKDAFKGFLRKYFTRIVLKKADAILPVSNYLKNALVKNKLITGKENIIVVRNIVEEHKFFMIDPIKNQREFLNLKSIRWGNYFSLDVPVMINVSSFEDKSKNLSGLLRSLKMLENKGVPFNLVLVGFGKDFEKIKNLSFELDLSERVLFTGEIDPDEVPSYLQAADFYVHPSNYESAGLAVSEAMMCGLPVVVTRLPALLEFVDEKCGFIVEPQNDLELSYAIELMLEQYSEFDRTYIRNRSISFFSKENIISKFVMVYEKIIAQKEKHEK